MAARRRAAQRLERGDEEGHGLAGAGLGLGHDVAPRQHRRQRGVLHRGEVGEPQHLGQRALGLGRQRQAGKGHVGEVAGPRRRGRRRRRRVRRQLRVAVVRVAVAVVAGVRRGRRWRGVVLVGRRGVLVLRRLLLLLVLVLCYRGSGIVGVLLLRLLRRQLLARVRHGVRVVALRLLRRRRRIVVLLRGRRGVVLRRRRRLLRLVELLVPATGGARG